MKKWICIAAVLLSGRSLLLGFDVSASFKLGLAYPFYTGGDYQGWLAFLEDDFLATEGYFVDFDTRFNGKGLGLDRGLVFDPWPHRFLCSSARGSLLQVWRLLRFR